MKGAEFLRRVYLYGQDSMAPIMAYEEFRQAGLFIATMEDFIEKSTAEEVGRLEIEFAALSEEEKGDAWAWNYPTHWEEVFGARIRSAFCTQICSHAESVLRSVCEMVQVIVSCPIGLKDMKNGAVIEQHRKYLRMVGQFETPSSQIWDEMSHLFRLRNILVHEQGFVGAEKDRSLVNFLQSLPHIKIKNGLVELQANSCPALLEVARKFNDAVFKEYDAFKLRERSKDA